MADYDPDLGEYVPTPTEKAYLAACGCPQCGVTGCSSCAVAPATWQTSFATVADNSCPDCETLNRTYNMAYVTGCDWQEDVALGCDVAKATFSLGGTAPIVATFALKNAADGIIVQYQLSGATCFGPNVLSFTVSNGVCQGYPATITVIAA